jgi:two-component system sensor histidine kinase YesM
VVYVNKLAKQELILAKKQAELLALQSQINPHFMFNSLESIRMRSLIKNEKETSEIIAKLAILIRQSIYWGNDIITIEEEIKYVKAYLEIQKYRFDEKLSFYINVCEKCLKINIPKITLVTFVENSCIHGIEHTSKKGSIIIDISIFQDNIEIVIEDTGKGMDENKLSNLINQVENANILMLDKSNSIGIINAFIRLKTYFKDNIKFNITSELNKGTKINLTISLRDIE